LKVETRRSVPIAVPAISEQDARAVYSAVASGWVSGRGKYVLDFEKELSAWLGCDNVISCTSGTSALHLALSALGVSSGDEVIIPDFSMGAVSFAVAYTNARTVLVDSERDTWNMDSTKVGEKVTPKTKAIIAMHTYGHMVNMGPLLELCEKKGIALIEDAAEAHGAEYGRKKAGTVGDVGCFSFFANKIVTTGEGGAVVTNNKGIAEKCRVLRDMAFSRDMSKKFLHESIGFNYRMTNMQAALGSSQLKRIEKFIETRRNNAKVYNSFLRDVKGIELPPEAEWAKNVFWMYSILVRPDFRLTRDELMAELAQRGIETRPFFVPVHQQPVFEKAFAGESYPVAENLASTGLNLPSGNTLTAEQAEFVSSTIKSLQ
jgi:perosamine synthetase